MGRMREHVFKESDTDKNHMISFDEFLAETQRDEFEKDPGWDTMDDEELYTDEEFQEFERLRHLAQKQYELSQGIDKKHMKIPKHVELKHPTFEVADLQKLIKQTTDDLEEADKQRKEEFKKYEMEKKFEKEMRLKAINDTEERKVVQEEMEKMEAKHNAHEKLKHPMTKDQLEDVWEEQHFQQRGGQPLAQG